MGSIGWEGKHAHLNHRYDTHTHTPTTGFAVDVWALGIILFILLTGVPPLELPTLSDPRFKMIATNRLPELLDLWQLRLSRHARDLLGRLLQVEPTSRATIAEVLVHPWVMGGSG